MLVIWRLLVLESSCVLVEQQGEEASVIINPDGKSFSSHVHSQSISSLMFIRQSMCCVANEKFDSTNNSDNVNIEYFFTFLNKINNTNALHYTTII